MKSPLQRQAFERRFIFPPRPGSEPLTPAPRDPPATDPTPDLPKPTDPGPDTTDPDVNEPQLNAAGETSADGKGL